MRPLERLYSGLQLTPEVRATLQELARHSTERDALVVFVTRRPSHVEREFIRRLANEYGLRTSIISSDWPASGPDTSLDPLTLQLRNRTGIDLLISLSRKYRRLLERKITALKHLSRERPVLLVPISFFAGRGPKPWPNTLRVPVDLPYLPLADLWQLFTYRFHRRALSVVVEQYFSLTENFPRITALRELSKELYRHEKITRGAKLHSKYYVENAVLSGKQLERVLDQLAVNQSLSRDHVFGLARKQFFEITASINGFIVELMRILLRPILNRLFGGVSITGIEHLKTSCAQGPTVLISSHRSHFDYLVLGYSLYYNNLPLPYVAAGNNLNFFPVGRLLRACGAFFIRRKVDNDPLYRTVLDRYIQYLIKHGHLLEFFIEGGRSRTGITLAPRFGILKSIVRCFERGERGEILIVPVSVSYEQLPEDRVLARERSGAVKSKESFGHFWRARLVFQQRFGPVSVNFGEPISLRRFFGLRHEVLPDLAMPGESENQKARRARKIEALGHSVTRQIIRQHGISASAIISAALWTDPQMELARVAMPLRVRALLTIVALNQGFSESLTESFWRENGWRTSSSGSLELHFCGVRISPWLSEILTRKAGGMTIEQASSALLAREILAESDGRLRLSDLEMKLTSDLYRNSILHHFVFPAAIGLRAFSPNLHSETIYQLLAETFALPPSEIWLPHLESITGLYLQAGIVADEVGRLTPLGQQLVVPVCQLFRSHFQLQLELQQQTSEKDSASANQESKLADVLELFNELPQEFTSEDEVSPTTDH